MAIDYAARKEALEEALLAGELTVESDGDRVTYRSIGEIRNAIAYCDERLASVQTARPQVKTTLASFDSR
ncbi:hypothetical protein AAG607_12115 [Citromicrobium bathyomarinum]|uniref:phage head-tail joining protein n=1 Tax=Citromicrobium bathyomarinum TaxID=72174 RepID=UPI00315B152D